MFILNTFKRRTGSQRRLQVGEHICFVTYILPVLSYRAVSGFSVCVGYSVCENKQNNNKEEANLRHILSYCMCLIACDAFMQRFAPDEVAIVVAEDLPEKRAIIKQTHSRILSPDTDFPALRESLPIRHIVDDVYFADPKRSALLQFADAYAFSFRRIYAGYSYANELKKAIEGPLRMIGDFDASGRCGYKILYSLPEDVVVQQLETAR